MFGFIENLKYGDGIRIRFGSFALSFARNINSKDLPLILKTWYKKRTGKILDLDNPQTFNEKIQWLKLYDNSPIKAVLADKYKVREWVEKKIGKEYLIPLIGVWDSFEDINFDNMPFRFVLKANHGSHWNVIVKDKYKTDLNKIKHKFDRWLKRNYAFKAGLELQYSCIKPKIVAEQYIEDSHEELNDYKILCFNGEPKFVWVDCGRYTDHRTKNIYDVQWNLQPFEMTYPTAKGEIKAPKNFEKMLELSRILSKDFPFVRVDFYNVDGKIYFGEMTFTSMSGVEKFSPEIYDLELGKLLNLPAKKEEYANI